MESLHSATFANKLSASVKVPLGDISRKYRRNKELLSRSNRDNQSRVSDQSLVGSKCLANSSADRKVSYNIAQNALRKKMIADLDIQLSLLMITGADVEKMEQNSPLQFDLKSEAFIVGDARISFILKDLPEDQSIFLDFCGDHLYDLKINGTSKPVDDVNWSNNQISMTGLRKGRSFMT